MAQVAAGIEAIRNEVDIHVACSLGMLDQGQVDRLAEMGVHRYNHNLESARSFFPNVVTTHTWEERWTLCSECATPAWKSAAAASSAWGDAGATCGVRRRTGRTDPHEVPLNFLNPRPGRRSATSR